MSKELVTFIAPSHGEPRYKCPLVDSLLAQEDKRWKLIVFNNGRDAIMREWVEDYKDPRITYRESVIDSGNWGTANRQSALDDIDTEYVINTSIQDYYLQNTVEELAKVLVQGVDLVHWPAINHLFRYLPINGEIAWGHIDWGQWCTRASFLREVGIVEPTNFSSDWLTLQAIIQKGLIKSSYKLERTLTIHN